jgi:hypothetical protein
MVRTSQWPPTPDLLTPPHAPPAQVDFASLKQNLELSEKTDFMNLKAENERLLGDIERLKRKLREEITRTQAGVRLDLNLEKVSTLATLLGRAQLTPMFPLGSILISYKCSFRDGYGTR